MNPLEKLNLISKGFKELKVDQKYKDEALKNLEKWMLDTTFADYTQQIDYLIEQKKWDLLLDSFYQTISFGTAGRRGPVGIGPNRINIWTLQTAAQGHSQYLLTQFGDEAKSRGVVIAFDVRKYTDEHEFDNNRFNPVKDLDCKTLAIKSAEIYAANGIKVYIFDDFTPTPELSFTVRDKKAISGIMISASHNPPNHNGQKVVNETGGQLTPPYDQNLVDTIINEVTEVKTKKYEDALKEGLIVKISQSERNNYIKAAKSISINPSYRNIKILYSPLHGTSTLTMPKILGELGFNVTLDKISGVPDPKFSSITFNIPNPEVRESFDNLLPEADKVGAEIILSADPDADRIGLMTKELNGWRFFTGNEIAILISHYMLSEYKFQDKLTSESIIVKTVVTTNLITELCKNYGIKITPDLLVGFKYIGEIMDNLEYSGKSSDFLLGLEESHGYTAGNYIREKDASVAAILLSELASKLKKQNQTLGGQLDSIYELYGYFLNYLTEIRLPGAEGMSAIAKIQSYLRDDRPQQFNNFKVTKYNDRWDGEEFLSETDKDSRNILIIDFEHDEKIKQLQLIVRPSGTEPKLKIYFEIGVNAKSFGSLDDQKRFANTKRAEIEKDFITALYKVIGIDFPERGFLLFWQLPAQDKVKYFEVENDIIKLKDIDNKDERKEKLEDLLGFLGSDPVVKVNKAFQAKYNQELLNYLELD